jgi:hypothetical protein
MRFTAFLGICLFLRHGRALLATTLALVILSGAAVAERPSAMKLFPEESLVFIRLANAHEFGDRFQKTSMGRMIRDPKLKPFVESLYGKAGELYAKEVEGKLGITWDDLKKLPKGEVAFAVVAREHKMPALLLLIDEGDEPSVADKLVDKALDYADKRGGDFSTEKIGDVEVTVVRDKNNQNRALGVFERENTIVVATDPNLLRGVLWHWDHPDGKGSGDAQPSAKAEPKSGEVEASNEAAKKDQKSKKPEEEFVPGLTIAQNTRFAAIVRECRRKQDPPPQLLFFIDPVTLIHKLSARNPGSQFVMGFFAPLGVDGIIGMGGALTYATEQYDDLSQFHILLENPRSGVLQLPAFEPGDTSPQKFVPLANETYLAWNCNLRTTYDRLVTLVDRFGSKGMVDKFVKEKISDKIGIDILTQVLDNLKGRFTWVIGYDKPASMNSRQHVVAAELKDEKAMTATLQTLVSKHPDMFEEKHFGNVTYYAFIPRGIKEKPEEDRPANPFVGIMDGYLFVGSSKQQFERCVAARDGTEPRLVDSEDYARTSQVIGRETAGSRPIVFSMGRMEESMRHWYEILTSPKLREMLTDGGRNAKAAKNPILVALAECLEKNELPPFDVLTPYFAPGGGILYDTDNGYHGISFTLRNKTEQ